MSHVVQGSARPGGRLELAYARSNIDTTRTDEGYCFKPGMCTG